MPAADLTPVSRTEIRTILTNVQVLRAAAATLVVVFHLKAMAPAVGIAAATLNSASLGVDLFFVISGFIMVLTTDVTRTDGLHFLKNRLARIVPLYWLMTVLVFALALTAPAVLGHTRPLVADLARSLAFIPYLRIDGTMRPLLFLGWSLNYEMFFYVLFAMAIAAHRRSAGRIGHVALAALLIVALVAAGMVIPPRLGSLASFYTNPKMIEFVAGMGIASLLPRLPGTRLAASLGLAAGFLWLLVTLAWFGGPLSTLSATGASSLILLAALSAERGGLVMRWPLLILLGDASYSLYLIHPFVTQPALKLWSRLGGEASPMVTTALFLTAILLSAVLAVATYRLAETPGSRFARRLLGARRPPIPARGL